MILNNIKRSGKKTAVKYHSQFKPGELKRINIIICDDEYEVARAAEEIVKRYLRKKGFKPHVYYTKNGIESTTTSATPYTNKA